MDKYQTLFKVLLGFSTLVLLIFLYDRFSVFNFYTHDIGGLEYELIYEIQRIMAGEELYISPAVPPYHITQKTPLYHFLVAKSASLINLEWTDAFPIYRHSRIVSFLLLFLSSIFCFKIGKEVLGFSTAFAILLAIQATFLLGHSPHYYSRMDILYHLFFVMLLFFLFRKQWIFSRIDLLIYSVLSVALFYTKQNGLAVMGIISICLLYHRQYKNMVFYLISSLSLTALFPFAIGLDVSLFLQNIIGGLNNGIDTQFLTQYIGSEYQRLFHLLLLISALLFYRRARSSSQKKIYFTWLIWAFFYLVVALITGLKYGAGRNYFTEYKTLSLFITFTLVFDQHIKVKRIGTPTVFLFALLTILNAVMALKDSPLVLNRGESKHLKADYLEQKKLASFIKQHPDFQEDSKIYILGNSFLINLLPSHILLPTYATFRASYKNDSLAPRVNLSNYLKKTPPLFVIIPENKKLEDAKLFDYSFPNYHLEYQTSHYRLFQRNSLCSY